VTQAGWYPDPAGQPQTFRYWDGSSWSEQTTGDPYAPPPVPPAPPPPPPTQPPPIQPPSTQPPPTAPPTSYGQVPPPTVLAGGPTPPSPYGPQPPFGGGFPPSPATSGSRSPALVIGLVVGAVLLLVGLSVAGFLSYRALADDDDNDAGGTDRTTATDPTPTDTTPTDPTPTDPTATDPTATDTGSTGSTPTDQQCLGGVPTPSVTPREDANRVSGGGLSIPVPEGYTAEVAYATFFTFADNFTPLQKTIEQSDNLGWVSIYGVGGLRKANGFDDPAEAAEAVVACMAGSPDLYNHFTGREDLSSGAITIDGREAFQITSELRVDDPDLTVEGDVSQVIVVDTGDAETFGLYITVVPIGDEELIAQQQAAVARIRAD